MMTAEQLKDSILLLALQGKLKTNCASDVPINIVLKKIYSEKGRINPIDSEQIPYDLPPNWEWARLEDLTDNCDNPFADGPFGSNLKREHYTEKHEVRIIQLSNIGENGWRDANKKFTTYEHLKTIERSKVNAGDIVIAKMMPAGRAIEVPVNDYAYVLSSDAVKFVAHPLLNKRFLLMAINSPVFREQVYSEVHGVTRVRTSLKKLKSYIVPLPPLEEQKRIVVKIEELMHFVEQYAVASIRLNTLNATFPDMMKKSLLQEAVQGKLVPQDPNDEPANLLVRRIVEEKKRLIKEGKLKKQKSLPEISEDEIPFDIPESWEWVRLGNIVSILGDGIHGTPKYDDFGEYFFVNGNNLSNGRIEIKENTKRVNRFEYEKYKKKLDDSSILVSINGTIGNIAFYNNEPIMLGKSVCYFNLINPKLKPYMFWLIKSDYFMKYAFAKATGTTIKNVSLQAMSSFLVPLPSIAEQKRIVAKVEESLPLCEGMK